MSVAHLDQRMKLLPSQKLLQNDSSKVMTHLSSVSRAREGATTSRTPDFSQLLTVSRDAVVITTPDGAIWAGERVGGISVFSRKRSHNYAEADGLHRIGVVNIEPAPDGGIWAIMRDGVAVLAPGGSRFSLIPWTARQIDGV